MGSKERSASRPHYYGAADFNLLVAWRFAPHNHADQADIGRQSLRLFRPRGLSAAPLGVLEKDGLLVSALPSSDMPGHAKLHRRVWDSLDRCQESQSVDFKESAPWDSLKWHITRTSMAMANLRDGGIIVVGVSERGESWELTGIADDHIGSYDFDDISDFIAKYASIPLELDVVIVRYRDEKSYLAIQVSEFSHLPCICRRNSSNESKAFSKSDVLIRPLGKPQTKKVEDSNEIRDLIELAAEKRARNIIEAASRIGLAGVHNETPDEAFDRELQGL